MVGATGASSEDMSELRYANISMFTWTTNRMVFGMRFGALAGVPVATGDISAGGEDSGFGLGDILVTPLSLYGRSASFDYQFQFTVWTPSGYFSPGSAATISGSSSTISSRTPARPTVQVSEFQGVDNPETLKP